MFGIIVSVVIAIIAFIVFVFVLAACKAASESDDISEEYYFESIRKEGQKDGCKEVSEAAEYSYKNN